MFRTDDRQSVCDALLPPEGYKVDCAVATTYSLDFIALTAIVAAIADCSLSDADEWSGPEVARAILGLKRRVVVYVNQGSVHPGRVTKARRLSCLYDRFVVPVSTQGVAFHPKMWLVKYAPKSGKLPARYRLICSSRNITTANTWECGVVLEGTQRGRPGAVGPSVARFISTVVRQSRRGDHAVARMLARDVAKVRFESPGRRFDLTFHGQHPGGVSLWDEIAPDRESEAVLVAPFITSGFLQAIRRRHEQLRVVGVQEELDLIAQETGEKSRELREWLKRDGNVFVVVPAAADADRRLDLHAKLLLSRGGQRGRTVIGSANGTASAWGTAKKPALKNWEAVVCLDGPECLSAFERQFMYEDAAHRNLRGWLEPYRPQKVSRDREVLKQLDDVQRRFGEVELRVRWQRSTRTLVLQRRSSSRSPIYDATAIRVRVAPFGLDDPRNSMQDASPLFRGGSLRFKPVELDHVSEFVLVELQHVRHPSRRKEFILMATVDGMDATWRDDRDSALLTKLVPTHELIEILLAIASGRVLMPSRGRKAPLRGRGGARAAREPLQSLLEPVLRAWSLNPDHFADMQSLLRAFGQSKEAGSVAVLRDLMGRLQDVDRRDGRVVGR